MRSMLAATMLIFCATARAEGGEYTLAVPQLVKPSRSCLEGNPLQQEYDAAWSRYDESITATTESVNAALQYQFKTASKQGHFPLAKEWNERKQGFSDSKTLDWPTDGKAKTEWRKRFPDIDFPKAFTESVNAAKEEYAEAKDVLKSEYNNLVRKLTMCEDLERAEQLLAEVASLERKPTPPPKGPPKPTPKPVSKPWPQDKKGAEQFRGHWYKVFPEKLSWHQAKARCEGAEGHLATIGDAQEEAFLQQLAAKHGARLQGVWIGATDQGHEGKWVWVDGQPVTYSNWGRLQPNNVNNNEHYAMLFPGGGWLDLPHICVQQSVGFVCEWDE